MPAVDIDAIRKAVPIVEAALKAAVAEHAGDHHAQPGYWERYRATMSRCAAHLTETVGARINDRWNGCTVRIAGIQSTCTSGMAGGLQNWIAAARRRMEAS